MSLDTPARLAILGAGPIGLEAALYARFLGYDIVMYDRGDVASRVRQAGQTHMTVPFSGSHTTLGIAALQSQNETYSPPAGDALLTCQAWVDAYLFPLSQTDLLADHLRLNTIVLRVEQVLVVNDPPDDEYGTNWAFRVHSRDATGTERADLFDGVLDCTGLPMSTEPAGNADANELLPIHDCQSDPYFHVIGSKTCSGQSDFLLTTGYDQIRKVFAILGDRATLDLYSTPYVGRSGP